MKEILRAMATKAAIYTRNFPGTSARFGVPRGFEVYARDWFEKNNGGNCSPTDSADGNRYHHLRDSSSANRPLPIFIDTPLLEKTRASLSGHTLPQFVASLAAGRYVGSCFGCVITEDDTLLQDISLNPSNWCREVTDRREHLGLARLFPRLEGHIRGQALVLNTPFSSNYHHFLLDTVPRIGLCKEAGIPINGISQFITDYRETPYQDEVFTSLDIPLSSILATTPKMHISADILHAPSISEPVCREEYIDYTPSGMEFVRRSLRPSLSKGRKRRLLLSRRLAKCRRWIEEDDALPALEKLGFERIECELLSVSEQARLFGEAEVVVMPHGGGMANCVFCEPGTRIFELFHPSYHPIFMLSLSAVLGFKYHAIAGEGAIMPDRSEDLAGSVDVSIPARRMVKLIKELL